MEYGADFSWDVINQITLSGYYAYENGKVTQLQRTATSGSMAVSNSTAYNWLADNRERTHSYGAAVEYRAIPKILTFNLRVDYTDSNGRMDFTFLGYQPTADAGAMDDFDVYRKTPLSLKAKYNYDSNLVFTFGCVYEDFGHR